MSSEVDVTLVQATLALTPQQRIQPNDRVLRIVVKVAIALVIVAGCSKPAKQVMTRQEACELLSSSSCAEISQHSNVCSSSKLDEWNTPAWRERLGTATANQYCVSLIESACCQKAGSGATDCKQRLDLTHAEAVVPVPSDDRSSKEPGFIGAENVRVVIDRENGGRVNFDKLAARLGDNLIKCARRVSESDACTPGDLEWLEPCVAGK